MTSYLEDPEPVANLSDREDAGSIQMRRVLPSSGWSLAGTIVTAVYSFALVGFLLRTLGPEAFAPWAATLALLGFVSLLDAGLSATTTRDAAHAAAGDTSAIDRIRVANALFAGLAIGAAAIGILGAFVIPLFLGLEGPAGVEAGIVAAALAIDFTIALATAGWLGVLRGYQRYDLIFACNVTHAVVGGIVVVALTGTFGMVGAAIGHVAGRLLSRVVLAILLRQNINWFRLIPGMPARRRVRALWAFSLPVFALQLSTQIGIGTDVIIVGMVAGAASVGLYAAGSQLVRNVAWLILPVLSVLLPVLSRATFEDALSTARQMPTLVLMAAILGGATFGGLAAEAGTIMQLWAGQQPPLSIGVLTVYSIAFVLITPVQVLVLGLIATGRHSLIGAVVIVDSVLNVVLSIVLSQVIGPIGVAMSTLIFVSFERGFLIPVLASRRLGLRASTVVIALYGGIAIGLVIVVLGQQLPVDGVAGLLVRIVVCGPATLLAMAVAWRLSLLKGRALASSPVSR
jgi:O-antigen/teichoic acid export membrane protein